MSEQDNAKVTTDEHGYDDGHWYASTLGHFIGLLVDAGRDPAVCFRVVADSEPDQDGQFVRRIDLLNLPEMSSSLGRFLAAPLLSPERT